LNPDELEIKAMSPTSPSIGLQALAVSVPDQVLTNDHWHENHPEIVAEAEQRIWMWKKPRDVAEGSEAFNREMAPYVTDPFRGARKRRFLPPGEKSLAMEADAARKALAAAGAAAEDVDLLICTSFLPDSTGIGGATFLAQELSLKGAAWNLETACSSNLLAFQTACGLVKAGQYKRVLVMCSCTYSRVTVESDPICWGIGDAAIAMVVGEVEAGYGHLGSHSVHSAATCGAVRYELELDEEMRPYFRLRTGSSASRLLRETSEGYLRECSAKALEQAGLSLADIDFCVFNTPLAWYAAFCARVLGFERSRTISVYPLYANVGPALVGLNLFHAAQWGKIERESRVLLYSVGSVSSCCAAVVRWGDVALGPPPEDVTLRELEAYEAEVAAAAEELAAA
jgi:3-oxoacyl-[acyl-carrier-protein] synthase-3